MAVPLWHIGLRIQYCHCSCSGCCCGVGFILAWELSHAMGVAKKKKKKKKKIQVKINETKSYFFAKINTIDKPFARLIKEKKKESTQINKIRNDKEVSVDTTETQRIIKDNCEQLYPSKMDLLEEMEKFLERHNLPRLNQEEIEEMNRQVTGTEIKSITENY